jgi:hypothetical protein
MRYRVSQENVDGRRSGKSVYHRGEGTRYGHSQGCFMIMCKCPSLGLLKTLDNLVIGCRSSIFSLGSNALSICCNLRSMGRETFQRTSLFVSKSLNASWFSPLISFLRILTFSVSEISTVNMRLGSLPRIKQLSLSLRAGMMRKGRVTLFNS